MAHKSKKININLSQLLKLLKNFNLDNVIGGKIYDEWSKIYHNTLDKDIFVDYAWEPFSVPDERNMMEKMEKEEKPLDAPSFSADYIQTKKDVMGHEKIHVWEGILRDHYLTRSRYIEPYKGKEERGIKVVMQPRWKTDKKGDRIPVHSLHEERASYLRAGMILAWPKLRDKLLELIEDNIKNL